jgi:hypothetical protein
MIRKLVLTFLVDSQDLREFQQEMEDTFINSQTLAWQRQPVDDEANDITEEEKEYFASAEVFVP